MENPLLGAERHGLRNSMDRRPALPTLFSDVLHAITGKPHEAVHPKNLPPPPRAREVLKSEAAIVEHYKSESVHLQRGLTIQKGKVDAAHILDSGNSDLVAGQYEGGFKLWECTIDLIETLRREMQDGHLAFRGKDVLELGAGHGLPGILTLLKGAHSVHFQDFNEEVLLHLTIPNVVANQRAAESDRLKAAFPEAETRFFAGDWADMDRFLSLPTPPSATDPILPEVPLHREGEAERDCGGGSSREEGGMGGDRNGSGHPPPLAYHRKLAGTPSFYIRNEGDELKAGGGYDIVLMSETVYADFAFPKLLALVKAVIRRPYGVAYLAGKKVYFGVGGGTRQFKALVEEDGTFHSRMIAEFADGSSNVREIWKFFFKD